MSESEGLVSLSCRPPLSSALLSCCLMKHSDSWAQQTEGRLHGRRRSNASSARPVTVNTVLTSVWISPGWKLPRENTQFTPTNPSLLSQAPPPILTRHARLCQPSQLNIQHAAAEILPVGYVGSACQALCNS